MSTRKLLALSFVVVGLCLDVGILDNTASAARYRSRSSSGYRGYYSPTGPSSRYNQYRVPFYMRADRRVLGLLP